MNVIALNIHLWYLTLYCTPHKNNLKRKVYSLGDWHVGKTEEVVAHTAQARQDLRERRHDQVFAMAVNKKQSYQNIAKVQNVISKQRSKNIV